MLVFGPNRDLNAGDLFYQVEHSAPEMFQHLTEAVALYARLAEPLACFALDAPARAQLLKEMFRIVLWLQESAPFRAAGSDLTPSDTRNLWIDQVRLLAERWIEQAYLVGYREPSDVFRLDNVPVEDLGGEGDYTPLTMQKMHWILVIRAAALKQWADSHKGAGAAELATQLVDVIVQVLASHYSTLGQRWEKQRCALLCDDDAETAAVLWLDNIVRIVDAWNARH